jgi:hypothetical protein
MKNWHSTEKGHPLAIKALPFFSSDGYLITHANRAKS